jgi:hypothetical protein
MKNIGESVPLYTTMIRVYTNQRRLKNKNYKNDLSCIPPRFSLTTAKEDL